MRLLSLYPSIPIHDVETAGDGGDATAGTVQEPLTCV
jgi:hypothetical protein